MDHSRRRLLLTGGATGLIATLLGTRLLSGERAEAATPSISIDTFTVTHTDDEWRKLLTPSQYAVLRHEGTERPYTSPLNDEHRAGTFTCAGCAKPVFAANTKFDSHTGWPSFWQPLDKTAVGEREDRSAGMLRSEVHCSRCGGHLGHVFDDGPAPTGLRYCMNGVAMNFVPAAA